MKKFFTVVIILAVLAITGYSIAYFVRPVSSIELKEYKHEVSITSKNAYIVRDETVYYSPAAGTVYNTAEEGERISSNSIISNVFNGQVDSSYLQRLKSINSTIRRLKSEISGSELYTPDSSSVENEVSAKMNDTVELSENNSVANIHDNKEYINSLRDGNTISISDKIKTLEDQKETVENSIPGSKSEITSTDAGIFSSYIDGLESVLTPERVKTYNLQYIQDLVPQEGASIDGSLAQIGSPICKVMNNHEWYILGMSDKGHRSLVKVDASVSIRFPSISNSTVTGRISFVSPADGSGNYMFLVEIPTYLESAFSYRALDAEIIFETYSGYEIPTDAIHTGDEINTYYVNGMKGSENYKCDVKILYTDADTSTTIIQSTDDAKNKLSSIERVVVGER